MESDELGRSPMTQAARLSLLEKDSANHAKTLTSLIERANAGFTEGQMGQFRKMLRDELGDAGLRIDEPDHIDEAREDFRFLRRLRKNWDGASQRVGGLVLMAGFGLVMVILGVGFFAWLGKNLGKTP